MKPIVVKTNDNKHILMTLPEFNKIIEQIYNEGFKDGQKDKENSPYINWAPSLPHWCTTATSTGDVVTIKDIKNGKSLSKLDTDSINGLRKIK